MNPSSHTTTCPRLYRVHLLGTQLYANACVSHREQLDVFIDERMQEDTHPLLARAFSLVTRELRERRKMSRADLSEASGLPLTLINRIERAKAHNLTLTQAMRIAMALGHDVGDVIEQVLKVEERLEGEISPLSSRTLSPDNF